MAVVVNAISGAFQAVGRAVAAAADVVGNVIKSVGSITVKAVNAVAGAVVKVGNTIGKIAESIAKDPLPTLITYAAQAVGIPAPLTAAAIAAARGSSIKDIAISAAAVYAGGKVAQTVKVPGLDSFSPATRQIIQNTVSGAAGSAAVSAVSGQPLDNILKSAAAGGISSAVQARLSQITNDAGQPLFKPGELTTQMINNASAQATLAVLNGKSIQTALENAAATTIASYGLSKVATAVKSTYDNLVKSSNELDALLANKNKLATSLESTASRYSAAVSRSQEIYSNYESRLAQVEQASNDYNQFVSQYQAAVNEIENIKRNPGDFDAAHYLSRNPDVARDPYFANNAREHYDEFGQFEGRQPNANFERAQQLAAQANSLSKQANAAASKVAQLNKQAETLASQYQNQVNSINSIKSAYDSQVASLEKVANQLNAKSDQVQKLNSDLEKRAKELDTAGQAAVAKDIDKAVNIATADVKDRILADRIASEELAAQQAEIESQNQSRIAQETRDLANRFTQLDPASQDAYEEMINTGTAPAQAMNQVESVIKEFNKQQEQQATSSGATEWTDNKGVKNILIKGVGSTVVQPEIQPPAPATPQTFMDKLSNIGGLLGLGTSDPNAVKEALLGGGATGGQFKFGIFGFDAPEKKQQAVFEIDQIIEALPSAQKIIAEDIKKALEAQPVKPKPAVGEPGGGGGGGTGAETPETAPPAAGPQAPQQPQLPLTPEVPSPPVPTGPPAVAEQDIVTQELLAILAEEERRRQQEQLASTGQATPPQQEFGPSQPPIPQPDTTGQQVGPSQPQTPETPQQPGGGGEISAPGGAGDSDKAILDLISGGGGTGEGGVGGTAGDGFGAGTGAGEGEGKGLGEGAGTGGGVGTGTGTGEGSGSGPGEGTGSGEILTRPRLVTARGTPVAQRGTRLLPQQDALLGALLGTGLTSGGTGEPILGEDESKRRLVWNVESLRNALGI
jgi:archaellum component FlaC